MPDYYIVDGFTDGHIAVNDAATDQTVMTFHSEDKEEEAESFIRYRRSCWDYRGKSWLATAFTAAAVLFVFFGTVTSLADGRPVQLTGVILGALVLYWFGRVLYYLHEIRDSARRLEVIVKGGGGDGNVSPDAPIRRVSVQEV